MTTAAQASEKALDATNHWLVAVLDFMATYLWPLLMLGAVVMIWRALKGR